MPDPIQTDAPITDLNSQTLSYCNNTGLVHVDPVKETLAAAAATENNPEATLFLNEIHDHQVPGREVGLMLD